MIAVVRRTNAKKANARLIEDMGGGIFKSLKGSAICGDECL